MAMAGSRINTVILLLILFALLAVISMLATDASGGPLDPSGTPAPTDSVKLPGTPISSVPYTITAGGRYYLTRNLSLGGAGDAIAIAQHVDFATIDLNGFTLSGAGSGTGIHALGPTTPSQYPLLITNGYVQNFAIGVDVSLAAHARIEDVHVLNTGTGIVPGHHAVIRNCTIANSTSNGILLNASLVTIDGCMIVDSGVHGISIGGEGNVVQRSQVYRSTAHGVHIAADDNVVQQSQIIYNNSGVYLAAGAEGNLLKANSVYGYNQATHYFEVGADSNTVVEDEFCLITDLGQFNEFLDHREHCTPFG